jgi:hypothetical protein
MSKRIEYQRGQKLGELIYLHDAISSNSIRKAMFRCVCGKEFITTIYKAKSGHTKSCGCYHDECCRIRATKHGLSWHPLHKLWMGIMSRCYNPNVNTYKYYGARGIKMHDEWKENPQLFFDYIEALPNYGREGYTLDREKNNKGYEPGNLRWADGHTQITNSRKMSNNTSGYTGITKHGNNWNARLNIYGRTIRLGTYKSKKDAVNARNKYIMDNNLTEYKIQEYDSIS